MRNRQQLTFLFFIWIALTIAYTNCSNVGSISRGNTSKDFQDQASEAPPQSLPKPPSTEDIKNSINVQNFGAIGDGITDDTEAIQTALDQAGTIKFPAGTFVVRPLFLRSNTTLILDPKTVLLAQAGYQRLDSLLNFHSVDKVNVFANNATIKMQKAEYIKQECPANSSTCKPFHSEWRHGVSLNSSNDIFIQNLISKDSGGDGFDINGFTTTSDSKDPAVIERQRAPSKNVTLDHCTAENNFRNGLSIVDCQNCLINGGSYNNTKGTAPEFGIDIEPNPGIPQWITDVRLINVRTQGNAQGGLSLVMGAVDHEVSVLVENFQSINDGPFGGILFANGLTLASKPGQILIDKASIENPSGPGVQFLRWGLHAPSVQLKNISVVNPGSNSNAINSDPLNSSGFLIRAGPIAADTYGSEIHAFDEGTGHIQMIDCFATDNRPLPIMRIPFEFWSKDSAHPLQDIQVLHPKGGPWKVPVPLPLWLQADATSFQVSYANPIIYPVLVSHSIDATYNDVILTIPQQNAAPQMTLPALNRLIENFRVTFQVKGAKSSFWLVPLGTDTIEGFSGTTGIVGQNTNGLEDVSITLLAKSNKWVVEKSSGPWRNH